MIIINKLELRAPWSQRDPDLIIVLDARLPPGDRSSDPNEQHAAASDTTRRTRWSDQGSAYIC